MTERVLGRSAGIVFSAFVAVSTCACMDQSHRDRSEPLDIAVVGQAIETADNDNDPTLCAGELRPKPLPKQVRRNVILVIGDGMQLEDEIAISRYLYGTDDGLMHHSFPYQGYVTTWDVSSYNKYAALAGMPSYDPTNYDPIIGYDPAQEGALPFPLEDNPLLYPYLSRIPAPGNGWWAATDSASAATAMSTGKKTDDGNTAWLPGDPPNGELQTVGEAARLARTMSFGIVSTQAFTAATPAAFSGHHPNRLKYPEIGESIIHVEPDVIIGGGYPKLSAPPKYTYISQQTYSALASSSTPYLFVERAANVDGGTSLLAAADQAVAAGKKLFGLFGTTSSNGIFEMGMPLDNPGNPSVTPGSLENPTLAQASLAALKVLSQNPQFTAAAGPKVPRFNRIALLARQETLRGKAIPWSVYNPYNGAPLVLTSRTSADSTCGLAPCKRFGVA